MTTLFLVHGGLWEDQMGADRFWVRPGVVAGLRDRGLRVLAPDRLRRPPDWNADTDHLLAALPPEPVTVVAGSNGCSVAVRLTVARPDLVERLVLAWPATAGDEAVDAWTRAHLAALGATPRTTRDLLAGGTLRGVGDTELAALDVPVAVLPAAPENPFHSARTVDALTGLLRRAELLPGCPEAPRPEFAPYLDGFLTAVGGFATAGRGENR